MLTRIAVTGAWLASTIALAASGEWHMKRQTAWDFNRWAWGMEMISMLTCVVPVSAFLCCVQSPLRRDMVSFVTGMQVLAGDLGIRLT
jgi:hypothetical protein